MNIPENLKYTVDHEWVMIEGERAKVGITDYAQDALGDVVFVDIPELGKRVTVGETVTIAQNSSTATLMEKGGFLYSNFPKQLLLKVCYQLKITES